MLAESTLEKLTAMRIDAMATAYREQLKDPKLSRLGFDERFAMLVDAEALFRDNRRLTRRLREAKLRQGQACLEDVDYPPKRELDRAQIRQLSSCRWVAEHHNVIVSGATGVGKTFIACALGQQACRKGYRVLYRRVPRLFEELNLARADGSYAGLLARLARIDVLVLDDWGIAPLREAQRHDLLEIMEDRDNARSTVIASQLPRENWHEHIGDPTVADAVLDRIIHKAYTIALKGPSRRKEKPQRKS
jgi:DNA replication protein DnaC